MICTDRNQQQGDVMINKLTDRLFGGIDMSWPKVIIFAVGTAVLTAVFLIMPVFRNTSFQSMGVTLEAWIFFAVIIMSNCRTPLESALKTFVFFLVSQPLIYLIQVPFNQMGWELFRFYRYWFMLTLLTFPMAYVGWYIRKKNWLSLLILLPVLAFLTAEYITAFKFTASHFPYRFVKAVFCLAQVLLYVTAFTSNIRQKLLGFLVPLAAAVVFMMVSPQIDVSATVFLPDEPVLTENASVVMENKNTDDFDVTIVETGTDSLIRIQAHEYGTFDFSILDGDTEHRYTAKVYEDTAGSVQIVITQR